MSVLIAYGSAGPWYVTGRADARVIQSRIYGLALMHWWSVLIFAGTSILNQSTGGQHAACYADPWTFQ